MKIVLLQEQQKLGKRGKIVEVKSGYARNFLFPQNIAIVATKETQAMAEKWLKEEGERSSREKQLFEGIAEQLSSTTIGFEEKTKNAKGELYGSIDEIAIQKALETQNVSIEKSWITLKEPLKKTGNHKVTISFPQNITGELTVSIIGTKN